MAKTKPQQRWLKANFERVSPLQVFDALTKFNPEGGNEPAMVVVFWTSATADEVRDAIWALNGGCFCEVVEIDEDTADQYL